MILSGGLERMDRTMQTALLDGRMLSSVTHWAYQGQNPEELKHLLFCTTLELESLRLAAKDEIKRQEENTRQLVHLLKATCRERDEARDQCQKLQEKLLQRGLSDLHSGLSTVQPDSPAGRSFKGDSSITECDSISGTYRHHSFVSSPAQSMFDTVSSIQEPSKLNLADSTTMDVLQHPYFEFSEEYHKSSFPAQNIQPVQLPTGCNTGRLKNSNPQQQVELQQKSMRSSSNPSEIRHSSYLSEGLENVESQCLLNLSSSFAECNMPAQQQPSMQSILTINTSDYETDIQCQPQGNLYLNKHMNEESKTSQQQEGTEYHSQSEEEKRLQVPLQKPSEHVQSQNILVDSSKTLQSKEAKVCSQFSAENESLWQIPRRMNTLEQMTALSHESVVSNSAITLSTSLSPVSVLAPIGNQGIPSLPSNTPSPQSVTSASSNVTQLKRYGDSSSNVVPVHLPEPPEADLQVIMNSLPEKGKLLAAVMKAGPLLQTLLLAGPLPQWRHPPPPLDSFEIPLVSIPTSNVVNPLLKSPQPNAPVHDGIRFIQSSSSVFCSLNQSDISQIPSGALLHPSASTSSSSNKRSLLTSVNGHFVEDLRPPLKYAKLQ
eukprot:Gb_03710 [translate_table: standard]